PQHRPPRMGVEIDRIRVRFTPGRGEVYGPPGAVSSTADDARSAHEIVPGKNRILNPAASWIGYRPDNSTHPQPWPADTYDGDGDGDGNVDRNAGWGVVDDTCDATIA